MATTEIYKGYTIKTVSNTKGRGLSIIFSKYTDIVIATAVSDKNKSSLQKAKQIIDARSN